MVALIATVTRASVCPLRTSSFSRLQPQPRSDSPDCSVFSGVLEKKDNWSSFKQQATIVLLRFHAPHHSRKQRKQSGAAAVC